MLAAIRARINASEAAREEGFTLIELMIVLEILAILLSTAVPSVFSFKQRALEKTAISNLRSLVVDASSYGTNNGSYDGMTLAVIKASYDPSVDDSLTGPYKLTTASPYTTYCAQYRAAADVYAYKDGPTGPIVLDVSGHC